MKAAAFIVESLGKRDVEPHAGHVFVFQREYSEEWLWVMKIMIYMIMMIGRKS